MSHITPPVFYLRLAGAVLLALCVVSTSSFAEPPDAAVEAQLNEFFEQSASDLDAMLQAKTDALLDEAVRARTAVLQERTDEKLAHLVGTRIDTELAARTNDSTTRLLASETRRPADPYARANTSKSLASTR